jgi:hypothetical protein
MVKVSVCHTENCGFDSHFIRLSYKNMSQADLTIYISIIEPCVFTLLFFYGFFILVSLYPYYRDNIIPHILFIKTRNATLYLFYATHTHKLYASDLHTY